MAQISVDVDSVDAKENAKTTIHHVFQGVKAPPWCQCCNCFEIDTMIDTTEVSHECLMSVS